VTDPSHYTDSKPEASRRWVKLVVIIAIVVALLVAVVLLVGGGGHGPGRHF
jgi:succinate dehydrogenase hydrophobic anchor subunit